MKNENDKKCYTISTFLVGLLTGAVLTTIFFLEVIKKVAE